MANINIGTSGTLQIATLSWYTSNEQKQSRYISSFILKLFLP